MKAFVILGLLACASAAPQYFNERRSYYPLRRSALENHFREDGLFDAGKFWSSLESEMERLEDVLNEFSNNFRVFQSNEGIVNNEYVITIPLTGFDVKDIVVKAREGLAMIQAVHHIEDGSQRIYMDLRTLPVYVNPAGNWIYEKDVLKIMFPLTKKPATDSTEVVTETEIVTRSPESREPMEPNQENTSQDADVGLDTKYTVTDEDIMTNVIPKETRVEATTYAVDLKNEVEFVPVAKY